MLVDVRWALFSDAVEIAVSEVGCILPTRGPTGGALEFLLRCLFAVLSDIGILPHVMFRRLRLAERMKLGIRFPTV